MKFNMRLFKFPYIKALAMGLSLTAMAATSDAADKDVLRYGMSAEFETLNPLIAEQAITKYMLYTAYRPLVVLSLDNRWTPMLIKEIPSIENKLVKKKGSGLEVTIELTDDSQWGDGVPVTCKDIEFTWKVALNPNVSLSGRESYENIKSITWNPKTPKRCLFNFEKAKFDFAYNLPDPLPEHIEGPVYEKFKSKSQGYDQNTTYTKQPNNPGLYNGPFMVSEVKLGSHVMFVPNPQFKGQKPAFKQIIFKLIPNGATLTSHLMSGDIDMISPGAGLDLTQAVAFDKKIQKEKLPYIVKFKEGNTYAHIDLNLDHVALKDLKVRQALAMAFNKKEIVDISMEGKAKVATQFVPESDPWYLKSVTTYPADKKKAAALLDEAGWKMGPKGIRMKDGKELTLGIVGAAGTKIVDLIETYIQSQWKDVGVNLVIKNEPARVLFGETTKHRKFDLALFSWSSYPEQSPRTTLHSSQIPTAKNSWSGQNGPGWVNKEVDKWIDDLETELVAKKREVLAQKVIEAYAKELPVIPIYFRPTNAVIPADMKNYEVSGHLFYETLYIEKWSRQ